MGIGSFLFAGAVATFFVSTLMHAFLRRRRLWIVAVLTLTPLLVFFATDPRSLDLDLLLLALLLSGLIGCIAGLFAGVCLQALQRVLKL